MHSRYLIAFVILGALIGCQPESFVEVPANPTPLLQGFQSYASKEHVFANLQPKDTVQLVENSVLPPEDTRPPFSIYVVRIPTYIHIGHTGTLQLKFFNNRLQQTTFYPSDSAAYLAALNALGIDLSQGRQFTAGYTATWSAVDYRGQVYVAWADKRLQEQSNRWISRYA